MRALRVVFIRPHQCIIKSSSYDEPSFAGVAAFLGEGDEPILGAVALSCLTKKALRFVNSAARELSGMILAPEASTAIVRRRVPDPSVSQAVPTEYIFTLSLIVLSAESTMAFC